MNEASGQLAPESAETCGALADVPVRSLLDMAARAGMRAAGNVEPNPMVGAVVWKDGRVLGVGHHRRFGNVHAEVDAINAAIAAGHSVRGSTLLVTLEPCNHTGKQPPCARAILDHAIARVVYARHDPHTVAAGGAEFLRSHGVACFERHDSVAATRLADAFVHRITEQLPWVICKWAQTIDGRVATRLGESKWISGERARARVHRIRARVDAVITGIGTVVADDPLLNARGVAVRRVAKRVICDTELSISLDSNLVQTARQIPTIIACDKDLIGPSIMAEKVDALRELGVTLVGVPTVAIARGIDLRTLLHTLAREHEVHTALVEAGPSMIGAMLELDVVDEALVYIAPMMLGDEMARSVAVGRVAETLKHARRYELMSVRNVAGDVELTYRRRLHLT